MDKVLIERNFYVGGKQQMRWVTKTISECMGLALLDGWRCTGCNKQVKKAKREDGTLCAVHINANDATLCPLTIQEKSLQQQAKIA